MNNKDLIGAGGGKPDSPVDTADNLFSRDKAEILLGICEGEIYGLEDSEHPAKSFYVGDVPMMSPNGTLYFKNVRFEQFRGTDNDGQVKFILGGEANEVSVNQLLSKDIPIIRTTSSAQRGQINKLQVRLQFQSLYIQDKNGTYYNTAQIQIAYKPHSLPDSAWNYFGGHSIYTLRGKTTGGYQKEFSIDVPLLTDDDWDIKIIKFNVDENDPSNQPDVPVEQGATKRVCEIHWQSYDLISTTPKSHPNTALIHVIADYSNTFTSIPDFSGIYKGRLIRLPLGYNPLGANYAQKYANMSLPWDGTLSTPQWSDNPAWCLYDIIMREYKKHYPKVQVDIASFLEAAMYCDEDVPNGVGGFQPRYTFNLLLTQPLLAKDFLQYVAGSFNAVCRETTNGLVTLKIDKWREGDILFTPETVVGDFNYSYSDPETRINQLSVTFINPELNWKEDRRILSENTAIEKYGVIPEDFLAVGCINEHEARRRGQIRLLTGLTEICSVSFTTNRLGMLLDLYDTIYVADDSMGWGFSGRIARLYSNTLNQWLIKTVLPVPIDINTNYKLVIQTYIGLIEVVVYPTSIGVCDTFNVFGNLPNNLKANLPEDAVFCLQSITSQTAYIGKMKPFRVMAITQVNGKPDTYQISALEINVNKWDDADNLAYSGTEKYVFKLPLVPSDPYNLQALSGTGQLELAGDGTIISRISFTWASPLGTSVSHYEVQWAEINSDQWSMATTTGTQVFISPVKDGATYVLQVQAVLHTMGTISRSHPIQIQHTVIGKSAPPSDVSGFTGLTRDYGILFTWNKIPDVDFGYYELRLADDTELWDTAELMATVTSDTFPWRMKQAGTYKVFIRAFDTSGNPSKNPTLTTVVIAKPNAVDATISVENAEVVLKFSPISYDYPITAYHIDYSDITQTVNERTQWVKTAALVYRFTPNFQGSRRFWIAAEDASGNIGSYTSVNLLVTPPEIEGIAPQVIDNNVLLRWKNKPHTFPIAECIIYESAKGATFEQAEEIGRAKGTFAAYVKALAGDYVYWIIPVDTAGNKGNVISSLVTVNSPVDYQLVTDHPSDFSGEMLNGFKDSGNIYLPVNTQELYGEHFTSRGWNTWQDAIDAGYDIYALPSVNNFEYSEEFDYGTILTTLTSIRVLVNYQVLAGDISELNITLSVKRDVNDSWTEYLNQDFITVKDFRYVKYHIKLNTVGDKSLISISQIHLKLDAKVLTDQGQVVALATDVNGTWVPFNVNFIDVIAITPSSRGSEPVTFATDWEDVPYPTGFYLYAFNSMTGERVTANTLWSARGY